MRESSSSLPCSGFYSTDLPLCLEGFFQNSDLMMLVLGYNSVYACGPMAFNYHVNPWWAGSRTLWRAVATVITRLAYGTNICTCLSLLD